MPAPAPDIRRAFAGGVLYFAIVFAVAFALGVARTAVLAAAPSIDRLAAVLVEAPILLLTSWIACGFVLRSLKAPSDLATRCLLGATAFACVFASETALGVFAAGRTVSQHFALYADPSHAVGLVAQLLFALMPLIRRAT